MKIAMFTNNYKPFIGGVPVSVERLALSLRKLGHEVCVFAPDAKGAQQREQEEFYCAVIPGIEVGGLPLAKFWDAELEKVFAQGGYDVIHSHHPGILGWTAAYLSCKYEVPLVYSYHTRLEAYLHYLKLPFPRISQSVLAKLLPWYIRQYSRFCDCVIAPTETMAEYLKEIHVKAPVRILPTGLAESSFFSDKEKVQKIRKDAKEEVGFVFMTTARLAKEKNLDFLFRALALYKEHSKTPFRLILAGEGTEREHLQKLAERLGLTDEIQMIGRIENDEIKDYCAAADIFLFPSQSETQGIVLLEAMAAGTPVIAVEGTGTCDIVRNGSNGYMTAASEETFVQKLLELTDAGNSGEVKRLKTGARKTAGEYHSDRIAGLAEKYYQQLAGCEEHTVSSAKAYA